MADRINSIGVLTGGGDCPGLNAVIRAVVKTAVMEFGCKVTGIKDGFEGLVRGPDYTMELTAASVRGILPRGGTILGTTNRGNPFDFRVVEDGVEQRRDMSQTAIKNLNRLGIEALIVIGGDGSLSIGLDFFKLGVPVVGIPKTIDNDLSATDYTFGYHTAVATATEALDRLHTTAESHHRIMVLEVMGRNAGWIAMSSGIAGGADIILIPEIPYDINTICKKIEDRSERGSKFSIIVVAEGAVEKGGDLIYLDQSAKRLGGAGQKVADMVSQHTGYETRVTVLGHLQRGGSPVPFDRVLSTRFGAAAARLAVNRQFGRMVCLKTPNIDSVSLEEATGTLKTVPPEGDLVETARHIGISLGEPA
ncbi:MAG TPA: ATP-dependent 6-phosphofructokinase [bacterium]|nr:ATP-dependent 6-phosphofructokinase [bacterium]